MDFMSNSPTGADVQNRDKFGVEKTERKVDVYFSADIETDGPIPGPYSILSFALVYAGKFDGETFTRPLEYDKVFYRELKPISDDFQSEALAVNGLDREKLKLMGGEPDEVMAEASAWVKELAGGNNPVFVAYPLSFDWTWLYWYFVRFNEGRSPFGYSHCFDIKTAVAVKGDIPIALSSRSKLPKKFMPDRPHTHHAVDDAIEQAEIFANIFEWGRNERV